MHLDKGQTKRHVSVVRLCADHLDQFPAASRHRCHECLVVEAAHAIQGGRRPTFGARHERRGQQELLEVFVASAASGHLNGDVGRVLVADVDAGDLGGPVQFEADEGDFLAGRFAAPLLGLTLQEVGGRPGLKVDCNILDVTTSFLSNNITLV